MRTKVKVVKNKLAPPFREAEFDVIYGEGVSKAGTVLDAAVEQGIVEKSGTWYTYKTERIGQGRENAQEVAAGQRRRPGRPGGQGPRDARPPGAGRAQVALPSARHGGPSISRPPAWRRAICSRAAAGPGPS